MNRYGRDVLAGDWRKPPRGRSRQVPVKRGMVIEDAETGFVGEIMRIEKSGGMLIMQVEDRHGNLRGLPVGPGFLVDGLPVELGPPLARSPRDPGMPNPRAHTASGSIAVKDQPARVARASRIMVEGRHDAELLEKVWGDDLRAEGIVVEVLAGADHLVEVVKDFAPSPNRRLGVLLDHLISGTKETRIAAAATQVCPESVLILGHPYVDIWQAVKPEKLGLTAWPDIPYGQPWKLAILQKLGWPASTQADIARGWARILGAVQTYTDLQPELLGRVEELIDFVTLPEI